MANELPQCSKLAARPLWCPLSILCALCHIPASSLMTCIGKSRVLAGFAEGKCGLPIEVDVCWASTSIWVYSLSLHSTVGLVFMNVPIPHFSPGGVNGGSTNVSQGGAVLPATAAKLSCEDDCTF